MLNNVQRDIIFGTTIVDAYAKPPLHYYSRGLATCTFMAKMFESFGVGERASCALPWLCPWLWGDTAEYTVCDWKHAVLDSVLFSYVFSVL